MSKQSKIFIFDTETTGLIPKRGTGLNNYYFYKDLKKYEECRLVSICWKIYTERGVQLSSKYYVIKPRDFIIDNQSKSTEIHGITHETSLLGVDIGTVFANLAEDIQDVNRLVAHNIVFDTNILFSELYRYNQSEILDKIQNIETFCTCIHGENVTKIQPPGWQKYKRPKLVELYEHLFQEKLNNAHNADADTEACARCYFKMI